MRQTIQSLAASCLFTAFFFGLTAVCAVENVNISGTVPHRRIPRSRTISFGRMEATPVSSMYSSSDPSDDSDDEDYDYGPPPVRREKRENRRQSAAKYRAWNPQLKSRTGSFSLTTKLVAINVATYALQLKFSSITNWGMKLSERILAGKDLYRLVTPMFLHGGIAHLMTNCYSLRAVGPDVESFFGGGRFLATYFVSGVTANLLSAIKSPNPSLGASGAVFGIIGGYYVFLNRNKQLFGRYGDLMSDNLLQTISINLFLGFLNPMVDNWGHIGGAIGGMAMSYWFGPRLYLAGLPNGDRIVVDKPVVRLPPVIESIPDRLGEPFGKIKSRMNFNSDLSNKPWRKKNFTLPRSIPNRSIKPMLE